MANARKCDRCLKCFDPASEKEEMMRIENPIFQTCEEVKKQTVKRRLRPIEADAIIDFCPECTKEFQKWMMKPMQDGIDEAIEKGTMKEQQDTFEKLFKKDTDDIKYAAIDPYYAKLDDQNEHMNDTLQKELESVYKKIILSDKSENEKNDFYKILSDFKRMVFNVYDNR